MIFFEQSLRFTVLIRLQNGKKYYKRGGAIKTPLFDWIRT